MTLLNKSRRNDGQKRGYNSVFGQTASVSTRRPRRSRALHGFTLIELLVVIAIISLLVSILLPSLQRVKKLARTAVCATNLRGIGVMCYMYGDMNKETLPPRGPSTNLHLWLKALYGFDAGETFSDSTNVWEIMPNEHTSGGTSIFQCPSWESDNLAGLSKWSTGPALGYIPTSESGLELNGTQGAFFVANDSSAAARTVGRKTSALLSNTVLMYDRATMGNHLLQSLYSNPLVMSNINWYTNGPVGRHGNDRANFVCADGHVFNAPGSITMAGEFIPNDPDVVDENWCVMEP